MRDLRERTLRAAACFGHRLMMDRVVPGGIAADLDAEGGAAPRDVAEDRARARPIELYDNTASLQDRTVTTGISQPELARQFGAGGHVGRASGGRSMRAARPAIRPTTSSHSTVPVRSGRRRRAGLDPRREVEQSLLLIEQILERLPEGRSLRFPLRRSAGEGVALAEAFRGDVLAWCDRRGGQIERCHLRDPSWFQWPLLEAAIEGNIVADFPLCNKSFNCSYSGHDL